MNWIVDAPKKNIVVMTGAGISAESGIQTFRGANGLWENHRIEEVASPIAFHQDPVMVWNFYLQRRKQGLSCQPNPGHLAVAELEDWITGGGGNFLLVTQNVDGLHSRAGSRNVIEMHGSLLFSSCIACGEVFRDESIYQELPPHHNCSKQGLLRPHIVWFGESLFPGDLEKIETAIEKCDIFIVIGTSGIVYPAAGLVNFANSLGKQTVCVNKDAPAFGRKAVLYATCFVNYNNPDIGMATRAVLAHNGVETAVVYPGCCGMPRLEHEIGRAAWRERV